MDCNIKIEDNKNYYYVITYYRPNNDFLRSNLLNTDVSIFEIDEWNDLLNKSEVYKKWINILNSESDYGYLNIQPELRQAVYYLYHNCDYCRYSDFTSLEYYEGNNQDIYERVFIESKNEDRYNISINNFRAWIINNYDNYNKNYEIIKRYEEK